jgi:hypothetical protein
MTPGRESPEPRARFVVTLEATYRQLRWWMKRAGRAYGVKILDAREAENQVATSGHLKSRGRR